MYFISFRSTHTPYYQTLLTSAAHRSSHSERKVDSGGKEREKERVSRVRDEEGGGGEYMHLAWLFPNLSILPGGVWVWVWVQSALGLWCNISHRSLVPVI